MLLKVIYLHVLHSACLVLYCGVYAGDAKATTDKLKGSLAEALHL